MDFFNHFQNNGEYSLYTYSYTHISTDIDIDTYIHACMHTYIQMRDCSIGFCTQKHSILYVYYELNNILTLVQVTEMFMRKGRFFRIR